MPERSIDYQSYDSKRNPGFQIQAPSLERLFIDSALALVDQQVKIMHLESKERHTLTLEAATPESLLLAWLNAVLALMEQQSFLPKRIYFSAFDGKKIQATLMGEKHDPIKHGTLYRFKSVLPEHLSFGTQNQDGLCFFIKVLLTQ